MKDFLIKVLIFIVAVALSWAVVMGLIYLTCLCFSWTFSLRIATGIWLIMILVGLTFPSNKIGGERDE